MDFQNISAGEIFGICIIGLLIQYVVIRLAVAHGNNSAAKDRRLKIGVMLLAEIAKKHGVPEEEIKQMYEIKD